MLSATGYGRKYRHLVAFAKLGFQILLAINPLLVLHEQDIIPELAGVIEGCLL